MKRCTNDSITTHLEPPLHPGLGSRPEKLQNPKPLSPFLLLDSSLASLRPAIIVTEANPFESRAGAGRPSQTLNP